MKRILGVFLFLSLVWACTSDDEGDSGTIDEVEAVSFERGPMLTNWADNIIIPTYEAFAIEMVGLETSFEAFKSDATVSNLEVLRASWLSAYTVWQRASMFEIGPAEIVDLRFSMNTYPTDTEKIEEYVVSQSYDLSLSSNRDAKGFPALDYLINGIAINDDAIILRYTGDDKDALIAYFDTVVVDMKTLTDGVLADWQSEYRDTFVANDGSSATASVDRFVNDYIFYFEKFLRAGKMGIPLGVFSGSTLSGNLEAYHKGDVSNALFLEGFSAVQDFFNGKHYGSSTTGVSLASYLDDLNSSEDGEDLSTIINSQIEVARELVMALSTFRDEIENNATPTNMLLAYDEVQRLVPLFKVDMVSAMSISVDFVDADGD